MNNKVNKVNEELIKLGQGKRLIQFRIEKGLNSRLAFAHRLNISVTTINDIENNIRRISKNLIAVITQKWPDTNEDWLLHGRAPKLLTIESDEITEVKEEVGNKIYQINCQKCIEKDKKIEYLRNELESLQKKYIECLEEITGLKNASSG